MKRRAIPKRANINLTLKDCNIRNCKIEKHPHMNHSKPYIVSCPKKLSFDDVQCIRNEGFGVARINDKSIIVT